MGTATPGQDRIADALVVMMTEGVSFTDWDRAGLLQREWSIWERTRERYGRIVVVSYDRTGNDAQLVNRLAPRPEVVWNATGASDAAYAATIPGLVLEVLGATGSVVVRTNQYRGGRAGVMVVDALRARGIVAALVARGGYIPSRWGAWEKGPGSAEANRVSEEEAFLCARADMVIGPRVTVDDLAWRYGIPAERTIVVPNWVVANHPPMRAGGRDAREVLVVGRVVPQKRVHLVIEAMGLMPSLGVRDARLTVVGGGPDEGAMRCLAESRGVRATFFGRESHDHILERMSRCGVFAQASGYEASPKTVLEAMAAGAPVVVTNTYGLGEIIASDHTGLVASSDGASLAQNLARLLTDEALRDRLGSAASAWARREHGIDRIAGLEIAAHQAALDRGSGIGIHSERRAA